MGSVVRVRLFSPFDRLCGTKVVAPEFARQPKLSDVLMRLVDQHPALESYILRRRRNGTVDFEDYFLACVGDTIVLPDDVLPEGAEVKLFAPHAGG